MTPAAVQVTCSTPQPPLPPGPPGPAPPSPPLPPAPGGEGCGVVGAGHAFNISCAGAQIVSNVSFASYGVPVGGCPALERNALCDADNPQGWGANATFAVESLCLGRARCNVPVDPMLFGYVWLELFARANASFIRFLDCGSATPGSGQSPRSTCSTRRAPSPCSFRAPPPASRCTS